MAPGILNCFSLFIHSSYALPYITVIIDGGLSGERHQMARALGRDHGALIAKDFL